MKDLILFPCNGNAREAVGVINAINRVEPTWRIVGFIDDNEALAGTTVLGIPVLGSRSVLSRYSSAFVLAVPGRSQNFHQRKEVINNLNLTKSRFATIIHPRAEIGTECSLGHNVMIMAGVVLTANVRVGNHCLIMSNSIISHDSSIADYSMVGSAVAVAGGVSIGESCYIGMGSRIREAANIAEYTLVGMGSVVLRSTDPRSVVAGVPARPLNIHRE